MNSAAEDIDPCFVPSAPSGPGKPGKVPAWVLDVARALSSAIARDRVFLLFAISRKVPDS